MLRHSERLPTTALIAVTWLLAATLAAVLLPVCLSTLPPIVLRSGTLNTQYRRHSISCMYTRIRCFLSVCDSLARFLDAYCCCLYVILRCGTRLKLFSCVSVFCPFLLSFCSVEVAALPIAQYPPRAYLYTLILGWAGLCISYLKWTPGCFRSLLSPPLSSSSFSPSSSLPVRVGRQQWRSLINEKNQVVLGMRSQQHYYHRQSRHHRSNNGDAG